MADADHFEFKLNGQQVGVSGLRPQGSLLDYVRGRGLTGAKEGCAEGECGSCAVLLVKDGPHGTRYLPANSCLVPLPAVAGQEVLTVEGLAADGSLCEVQRAIAEGGGSQCGFCIPGMVVSMFAEHYRRDSRPVDIESLTGNLCRCTGYRPIRDALLSLDRPPAGPHLARLQMPAPKTQPLRYATRSGRFSRPKNLAECFELLDADPYARVVAGNTDLGVLANLHDERFGHLVAVDDLAEIRVFRDSTDAVEIGAALTFSEIRERWTDAPVAVEAWLRSFASKLIRHRATLGGNLATASPIGDSAPLLLAWDAEVVIGSRAGHRTIPLAAFFIGYRRTALERGDVLLRVRIPKPLPHETRFYKVAKRLCDDIGTVAAGIAMWRDVDGLVARARIAYGGVASTATRAPAAEEALIGTPGSDDDFNRARALVASSLEPISDHRGTAQYRVAVACSLLSKFHSDISTGSAAS